MKKTFKESIKDLDIIKEELYNLQDKKIKYDLNNNKVKKVKIIIQYLKNVNTI